MDVVIPCDAIQQISCKRQWDVECDGHRIWTSIVLLQDEDEEWDERTHEVLCIQTEDVIQASRFFKDE